MEAKIIELGEKKMVGMRAKLSLSNDLTATLFKDFMPRRKEIEDTVGKEIFCLQVYGKDLNMQDFRPDTVFEKWAAMEVSHFDKLPMGMETYTISGGTYAVFVHKGPASTFGNTMGYIFNVWMPKSGYRLDGREHFEILTETYRPNDPDAEEEVWVPVMKV